METTHSFDETPTPTRFIRNCDDIGLFQDLQLNPFEETFRIAVESSTSDLSNVLRESVAKPIAEETLNTPKIIAITKSDTFQHIYNIMEEDDSDDFMISPNHFLVESVDRESTCEDKDNNMSEDSEEVEIIEEQPVQQNGFATHIKVTPPTTVNAIVSAVSALQTSNSANTITYTINGDAIKNGAIGNFIIQTAASISPNNNSSNDNDNKPRRNQPLVLPKTVITTTRDACKETPKLITSKLMTGVAVKKADFVYQLSNTKLPTVTGKNVIILPSRNCATKASTSHQPIRAVVSSDEHTVQRINVDSDIKEKLRNLIGANSSQFIDEPIPREGRKRSLTESSINTIPGVDEKREYSRERNRMAQKRCRMRKKKWLMQMKKDTEVVLNENQVLQDEVGNLRAEVAHLKTLLLAHRNCSVTRAMFKADLSTILNDDISDIAENVEIPVPDSTNDCDETATKINYSSIVTHRQVNQVNHHVNHIHVHVPPSPQSSEDVLESAYARSRSGQYEIKPLTQTRKLIFDSKVVPIKLDDRSAGVLYKQISSSSSSSSTARVENANSADSGRECPDDSKPMQSTEVSGSTQWFRRLVFDPAARELGSAGRESGSALRELSYSRY